jgi:hypothetical protein
MWTSAPVKCFFQRFLFFHMVLEVDNGLIELAVIESALLAICLGI